MSARAPHNSSRTPLLVIGAVLLLALALGGILKLTSQGSAGDSGSLPSPQDLPDDTVAVVVGAPGGLETVTKAEFEHAIEQAAATQGLQNTPAPGENKYRKLGEAALGELLDAAWIQGEAEEMGISVPPEEVAAELAKLKRQSFKDDREYREFVTEQHYTKADIDERVTIQMLSTRIQRRIQHRAGPSESKRQDEFADFVKAYTARWRSRTVCEPSVVDDEHCSNGKKPAAQRGEGSESGGIPGAG